MADASSYGLCENCVTGFALPGTPRGTEEQIGPYKCYVAKPQDGNIKAADKVLIYFYDAFGLKLQNNKIIPDKFADKLGITVLVPDMFNGGGLAEEVGAKMPSTAEEARQTGFLSKLTAGVTVAKAIPWFISNRPATKYADIEKFLKVLREEKGYKKLGGIGYCYGGGLVIRYASRGELDVVVAAHPSLWAMEDVEALQKPISFALCEEDNMMPEKSLEQVRAALKKKEGKVPYEIKQWPGTVHGNFARPNLANPQVKAGFKGAFAQSVNFFAKHLVGSPEEAPAAQASTEAAEPAAAA